MFAKPFLTAAAVSLALAACSDGSHHADSASAAAGSGLNLN